MLWHFEIFPNTGPYGLEISKRFSSYSFHLMSAKLYEDIGYHGGIQAITFIANWPSFKNLWHFEILTWESMGKRKMWHIFSKRLIVERNGWKFGTLGTTVHICSVPLMPACLSLVWGHSVHFANFQFYNFLLIICIRFKLYTRYHNHTGCHFNVHPWAKS